MQNTKTLQVSSRVQAQISNFFNYEQSTVNNLRAFTKGARGIV